MAEELLPPHAVPAPDIARRVSLKEVESRAHPQGGAFRIAWESKKRVLWTQERWAAFRETEAAVAEARNAVSRARREVDYATARLSQLKCTELHVAVLVIVACGPEYHRKCDVPVEYVELTDHSGHVFTYDREVYAELSRSERPRWRDELAALQDAVKQQDAKCADARQLLAAAERELTAAETALAAAEKD